MIAKPPPATPPEPEDIPPFERGLWNNTWFMLLLCPVFMALDWELVPVAVFPFILVFPVLLLAWNRGLWLSVACAAGMSLTRMAHEFVFAQQPLRVEAVADALICFFVLQLLALLTTGLGRQSRQLRYRVRALEGLLAICAYCKCIRNERGEWVPVEDFIAHSAKIIFTHSLCPTCANEHFGVVAPPQGER
jgi:hypothetical protein